MSPEELPVVSQAESPEELQAVSQAVLPAVWLEELLEEREMPLGKNPKSGHR